MRGAGGERAHRLERVGGQADAAAVGVDPRPPGIVLAALLVAAAQVVQDGRLVEEGELRQVVHAAAGRQQLAVAEHVARHDQLLAGVLAQTYHQALAAHELALRHRVAHFERRDPVLAGRQPHGRARRAARGLGGPGHGCAWRAGKSSASACRLTAGGHRDPGALGAGRAPQRALSRGLPEPGTAWVLVHAVSWESWHR